MAKTTKAAPKKQEAVKTPEATTPKAAPKKTASDWYSPAPDVEIRPASARRPSAGTKAVKA